MNASTCSRESPPGRALPAAPEAESGSSAWLLDESRDALRALTRARAYTAAVATAIALSGAIALPLWSLRAAVGRSAIDAGPDGVRLLLSGRWPPGWGTDLVTPGQRAGLLAALDLLRSYGALAVAMACATVATIVLARATARRREVALRAALGAKPGRVVAETVLEAVLLAALALAGMALLAGLAWVAMARARPELLRAWLALRPAADSLAAATGAALALLLLAPLAALPAAWWRLSATLGSAHSTAPPGEGGLRHVLAVAQLGAAIALLIGAGLLWREAAAGEARGGGRGFSRAHPAAGDTRAGGRGLPPVLAVAGNAHGERGLSPADAAVSLWTVHAPIDPAARPAFFRALAQGLARSPGGPSAGASSPGAWVGSGAEAPLQFTCPTCRIGLFGTPIVFARAQHFLVGPGFFATLGLPAVRGRELSAADADSAHIAVINRSFEALFQGTTDPIGQSVRIGVEGRWYRIVGVVPDVRARGVGAGLGAAPAVYLPLLAHVPLTADLLARGLPAASVTRAVSAASAGAAGTGVASFGGSLGEARARLAAPLDWLAGVNLVVAGVVLLLGIYGVAAVAMDEVRRRGRELALRSALGATPLRLGLFVLRRALGRVAAGAVVAVYAAVLVAWLLERMSPGVQRFDVRVYGAAVALVALVALLASAHAVRSALRIEPREALADK